MNKPAPAIRRVADSFMAVIEDSGCRLSVVNIYILHTEKLDNHLALQLPCFASAVNS